MTQPRAISDPTSLIRRFEQLTLADVAFAGGKGSNLGELIGAGFPVPPGFVIGAPAYGAFSDAGGLRKRLNELLRDLDVEDAAALEAASDQARAMVMAHDMPDQLERSIGDAYELLSPDGRDLPVAIRSSATTEDSAEASFAGMHESFLNVRGKAQVVNAVNRCWASLFGARSIFYRAGRGQDPAETDIAVIVQIQIEATRAGVMFTADPATGESDRIVIEAAFGLGEPLVLGRLTPDRFVVDKRNLEMIAREVHRQERIAKLGPEGVFEDTLSDQQAAAPALADDEIRQLAELGLQIERHYGAPQDTEWAYDTDSALWMLQSRPITVHSRRSPVSPGEHDDREPLLHGLGASPGVGSGKVRLVAGRDQLASLVEGDVLVAEMTAPDWVPLMRKASAIVTDAGGMTCHAAIVSRELGIPAVVGSGQATQLLSGGMLVTVDGLSGDVFSGLPRPMSDGQPRQPQWPERAELPTTGTAVMLNLSEPSLAGEAALAPSDGVGLLRAEMMLLEALGGVHPRLLIERGQADGLVEKLAEGVRTFAAAFNPRPITYRAMDFRSNEFRGLDGGERFEPIENNPMIGYRGAARYVREPDLFKLELAALARVIDDGFSNLRVMLPFIRTAQEFVKCRSIIDESGLTDRAEFEIWAMAEVPSIYFNLEAMAEAGLDGISIGSNDLTQLMLGIDRDSEILADSFDERDPAVERYIQALIRKAASLEIKTSICGQAPSVHPEYANLLVTAGIDSISVSADAFIQAKHLIAAAERRMLLDGVQLQQAQHEPFSEES